MTIPLTTPDDAFIVCHACKSSNTSDATKCAQCSADLLPGRSIVMRSVFAGIGIIGLGIPIYMLVALHALPGLLPTIILIPTIIVGFSGVLSDSPASERLVNHAERYMQITPHQAVLDTTKSYELATNNGFRCMALEKRGEAFMALGKYTEALADFRRCQTLQPDNPNMRGLIQATAKKAQSKIDEIVRMES